MKKIKLALWVAALAALALVMIQNWAFFRSDQSLHLNLFYSQYQLPEWPVAVLFLSVFIFGCLMSGLSVLPGRIQSGLRIKRLNTALAACTKKISEFQIAARPVNCPEKSKSIAFWRKKGRRQNHLDRAADPTVSVDSDGYLERSPRGTQTSN
jgi:uncharacterized integral membrane protein